MKCKNCGGEMDSQAIRCPYCNSENPEGILFQRQVQDKLARYIFLKPFILKQKTPEMISKYLTRLLLILAGTAVLLWVFSFLVILSGEYLLRSMRPAAGTYAGQFADYNKQEFYIGMNNFVDGRQKGETMHRYEVERLIESGWGLLVSDETKEEQKTLIAAFFTEYMGLTEEELNYCYEHESPSYSERKWISKTAERICGEGEEGLK